MSKEKEGNRGITWAEYKERENFDLVVGVIGGTNPHNETQMEKILTDGFVEAKLSIGKFAVLSGGTEGGVPELAIKVANKLDLPSVGVYPEAAEKYALKTGLGHQIAVPSPELSEVKWGVESPVLTSLGDVYVMFGGEWGSLVEVGMIMKRNKSLVSKGNTPIPLIVVNDSGPVVRHVIEMTSEFGHNQNGLVVIQNGFELGHALTSMFS